MSRVRHTERHIHIHEGTGCSAVYREGNVKCLSKQRGITSSELRLLEDFGPRQDVGGKEHGDEVRGPERDGEKDGERDQRQITTVTNSDANLLPLPLQCLIGGRMAPWRRVDHHSDG